MEKIKPTTVSYWLRMGSVIKRVAEEPCLGELLFEGNQLVVSRMN